MDRNRLSQLIANAVMGTITDDEAAMLKAVNIPMIQDGDAAIDELFAEDVYKILFDVIDQLPERVHQVFLLYAKGKKNQEIAEALNISLETVKTYKKRGKQMIRERMTVTDFNKSLTLLLLLHILSS